MDLKALQYKITFASVRTALQQTFQPKIHLAMKKSFGVKETDFEVVGLIEPSVGIIFSGQPLNFIEKTCVYSTKHYMIKKASDTLSECLSGALATGFLSGGAKLLSAILSSK